MLSILINSCSLLLFTLLNLVVSHGQEQFASCAVVHPKELEQTMPCQMSLISSLLPQTSDRPLPVVLASPVDGCSEISINIRNAIVLVKRGNCLFENKAQRVQDGGGAAMILVNNDPHALFAMSSLNVVQVAIPVVMISKTNGDFLMEHILDGQELQMTITTLVSRLDQCAAIVEGHVAANVPFSAVFAYYQCSPQGYPIHEALRRFPELPGNGTLQSKSDVDEFGFWCDMAKKLAQVSMPSDIAERATLHALMNAVLLLKEPGDGYDLPHTCTKSQIWSELAWSMADQGYYDAADRAFQFLVQWNPTNRTLLGGHSIIQLVQGQVDVAIETFEMADVRGVGVSGEIPALWLLERLLRRLASFEQTTFNKACLLGSMTSTMGNADGLPACCDVGFVYKSDFVKELYFAYTQMGVYLDELGALGASRSFFQMAHNLCGTQTGLKVSPSTIGEVCDRTSSAHRNELHSAYQSYFPTKHQHWVF